MNFDEKLTLYSSSCKKVGFGSKNWLFFSEFAPFSHSIVVKIATIHYYFLRGSIDSLSAKFPI